MKDIIRIKVIAKTAEIPISTFDRILHKQGNVSKESEAKVLQV